MGSQGLLVNSFDYDNLIVKTVISGAQGLLIVMGSKFLIKITWLQTIKKQVDIF